MKIFAEGYTELINSECCFVLLFKGNYIYLVSNLSYKESEKLVGLETEYGKIKLISKAWHYESRTFGNKPTKTYTLDIKYATRFYTYENFIKYCEEQYGYYHRFEERDCLCFLGYILNELDDEHYIKNGEVEYE